jgi:transcriptional regulator with XRE-family HTH domain
MIFVLALALIFRLNLSFFNRGDYMVNDFNKHLGEMLKKRRLALGLTQTKVAKAINVTFQQIQKYEKGINGVSSVRLLQLASYLKVQIAYFFDNYPEYLSSLDKTSEDYMSVNYNFLVKVFSELTQEQKIKFIKLTGNETNLINKRTG